MKESVVPLYHPPLISMPLFIIILWNEKGSSLTLVKKTNLHVLSFLAWILWHFVYEVYFFVSKLTSHLVLALYLQMLQCIIGMVDKTKRAVSVLQQRCQQDREEMLAWVRKTADETESEVKRRAGEWSGLSQNYHQLVRTCQHKSPSKSVNTVNIVIVKMENSEEEYVVIKNWVVSQVLMRIINCYNCWHDADMSESGVQVSYLKWA